MPNFNAFNAWYCVVTLPGMSTSHMLCIVSRSAAAAIAGGLLLLSSQVALAQNSGDAKPPEQAQGEQKPPEEGQKPADAAAAEHEAQAKAIAEYEEAKAKLPRSAGAAECVWTGRRIASLLWRDDIDTANRYIGLYDRFGCSQDHLRLAFRCVVQQGPIDPKAADRLASRVHNCWVSPDGPGEAEAATATTTTTTTKSGTVPN
jgi:hypothetical protein